MRMEKDTTTGYRQLDCFVSVLFLNSYVLLTHVIAPYTFLSTYVFSE